MFLFNLAMRIEPDIYGRVHHLFSCSGPHIRFPFWEEGPLWILGSGASSSQDPASGAVKPTRPGPREGSSILNVDRVVVTAAVPHMMVKTSGTPSTEKTSETISLFCMPEVALWERLRFAAVGFTGGAAHTVTVSWFLSDIGARL